MLSELPNDSKLRIFHDFLYQDFLSDFRRFFTFRKDYTKPIHRDEKENKGFTHYDKTNTTKWKSINKVINK